MRFPSDRSYNGDSAVKVERSSSESLGTQAHTALEVEQEQSPTAAVATPASSPVGVLPVQSEGGIPTKRPGPYSTRRHDASKRAKGELAKVKKAEELAATVNATTVLAGLTA